MPGTRPARSGGLQPKILYVKPFEVRLAADELLLLVRVAAADRHGEAIRHLVVGVEVARVRRRVDVVRDVVHVQDALERHEVVHVTGFLEVVEAGDVVELVVERAAVELELLRQLVLVLASPSLPGSVPAVPSRSMPTSQSICAVAGDRLEREVVRELEVAR